jgi:hypothetical protein
LEVEIQVELCRSSILEGNQPQDVLLLSTNFLGIILSWRVIMLLINHDSCVLVIYHKLSVTFEEVNHEEAIVQLKSLSFDQSEFLLGLIVLICGCRGSAHIKWDINWANFIEETNVVS